MNNRLSDKYLSQKDTKAMTEATLIAAERALAPSVKVQVCRVLSLVVAAVALVVEL
jgi:hypothetical protein